MGSGGDSKTNNETSSKVFNQNSAGANLSNLINLGTFTYGNSNTSSPTLSNTNSNSLSSSNDFKNDNKQKGGDGGEGGGAALDLAASLALTGHGNASSGEVAKSGGGASFTPKNNNELMVFASVAVGSIALFSFLNKGKK